MLVQCDLANFPAHLAHLQPRTAAGLHVRAACQRHVRAACQRVHRPSLGIR